MRKMNKLLTLILVLALTVGLMACGSKEQEKDPDNENPVTEDNNKTPDDENSTTQNNDEAISSGKIAVIRNRPVLTTLHSSSQDVSQKAKNWAMRSIHLCLMAMMLRCRI